MSDKRPGRPPSDQTVPAADRIRQFRQRQAQSGLVRTEVALPRAVKSTLTEVAGQLGLGYAQTVSTVLRMGLAAYQNNLLNPDQLVEARTPDESTSLPLKDAT